MTIHGYAALEAGSPLSALDYEPGDLGPNDVEVRIEYCGICRSDIHLIDDDWAMSRFPFIPGHEIVGTIVSTGRDVTDKQPGQRVGIGWQAGSCLQCAKRRQPRTGGLPPG